MPTPELVTPRWRLYIPVMLPDLNQLIEANRKYRLAGARFKKDWTWVVTGYARQADLPSITQRVHLKFLWLEPDRRRDPDNICGGGRKLILDGLIAAGLLPQDGWRYIAGFQDAFLRDPKRPGVIIEVVDS